MLLILEGNCNEVHRVNWGLVFICTCCCMNHWHNQLELSQAWVGVCPKRENKYSSCSGRSRQTNFHIEFVCFCLLAAPLNNKTWKFNSKNLLHLQRLYSKGSGHWEGFSCSLVTDLGKPMFSMKYLPHLKLSLFEASMKLNHIPNLLPTPPPASYYTTI